MTAVNVFLQRDAVRIVSDGAVYNDSGVFQHAAPKCFGLPHLQCAIAFRGGALAPLLANTLAAACSYSDLKGKISYYLNEAIGLVKQITRSAFGSDFQLFVGGWGDDGPESWTVLTRPDTEMGLPAWMPIPIAEQALTPFESGPLHQDVWDIFRGRSAAQLDPRVDGLQILESQRRHKIALPDGRRAHIVGGFAQLTTVHPDKITTEVIKHWADVPGQKIKPD